LLLVVEEGAGGDDHGEHEDGKGFEHLRGDERWDAGGVSALKSASWGACRRTAVVHGLAVAP
jgi:hypothetical protein